MAQRPAMSPKSSQTCHSEGGVCPRNLLYLVTLVSLLLLFFVAFPSSTSAKDRRLKKFFSEVVVLPNGSVDVTENITFQFLGGPWRGITRYIPIEYSGPRGLNYTLFLDVTDITDENGAKLRFESSRERHYLNLKIYIPNADDSTRTISIHYTVSDALKFFDDHDEFYWNVTGDEWSIPIESAGAHIVFPNGTSNLRAKAFTGAYRSTGRDADVQISGTGVDVRTRDPLPIHEGLTIAVAFDKGTVREPSALARLFRLLRSNWPLFIPIIAFFAMFWWWWTHGRDPRLRPIAAQYQPPDNLSPGEVGTLIDNSVNMRDITASIVDLAVRGFLVIEEAKQDHLLGLSHSKTYIFHLKKSRSEWASLKPHEQELLDGIFTGGNAGDAVPLDALHNTFYANIPAIRNQIFASLVGDGYYAQRPDSVRSSYILFGIVTGIIVVVGGIWVANHSGMQPLPFIVAGLLTGAIVCGFGWFMPARTQAGARALEGALGFEDFLAHVESDRFNRTIKTPEMFEKFLPFAMALGVEKNWSKAFQGIYTQPPQWYQGSYGPGFYPYLFVNDLGSMSSMASDVMTSSPRSAEGSAFSGDGGGGGGGFSGGGFGGGGGDAF
ncbi:MAG TPA: DUF2207 domain-containing protein [Candidatus Acidoferrum sp.]|nr:DUF2207 domain-containing protein [Candidatus Acidoferrum sp.]